MRLADRPWDPTPVCVCAGGRAEGGRGQREVLLGTKGFWQAVVTIGAQAMCGVCSHCLQTPALGTSLLSVFPSYA